jgi:AraC-like DNA-binding protein
VDAPIEALRAAGDPSTWQQRVGALGAVPGLLAGFGVDPCDVLAASDLPPDALAHPDNRVPYAGMARLLEESVRRTGCEHFGLLAGGAWRTADLGLAGEMLRHSPTVGEGLRSFVVHQRLNSAGGAAFLFEESSLLSWGYAAYHPRVERYGPLYDAVIALGVTVLRELIGPGWSPTEVLLARHAPVNARPYRQLLRCPVHFDAEVSTIRFPARLAKEPVRDADPVRRAELEALAARAVNLDLVPSLYRSLRLLLLEGTSSGNRLAQQFDMHRRTLNRRLHAQGRTFQSVLDDVRFEVARQLLAETVLPVVAIAHALGYAEASALTRAFRRWAGCPPLEWRATHSKRVR